MKTNQAGQSTIEFILTFMFGMGVVFLFINVAVNYSAGYLVHYATFMAARTYSTVDSHITPENSDSVASTQAMQTFARFKVDKVGVPLAGPLPPGLQPGLHINSYMNVRNNSDALMVGLYAVFQKPLSYFQNIAGGEPATFVSEAFLGKEPTRNQCWEQTCAAIIMGVTGAPGGSVACGTASFNLDITVFDNGC